MTDLTIANAPYSIKRLFSYNNSATYLIREHDRYGEYPNIWVKVYTSEAGHAKTIILTDTGTGLDEIYQDASRQSNDALDATDASPSSWNIATFLHQTLDIQHDASYIVITSHCHYDHIMGIQHLLKVNRNVTILSSSHNKSWLTPYRNLQEHSLCERMKLRAPNYDARWIEDVGKVFYHVGDNLIQTSLTVIHTPGHTPDSLSWYDSESSTLFVGDMLYEKESDETRSGSGQWKGEPPMPVIFGQYSNIIDWNASMHRLLDFVRRENLKLMDTATLTNEAQGYRQTGQGTSLHFTEDEVEQHWSFVSTLPHRRRVVLCAAHVTVAADAETALSDMLTFMFNIQLDQVPKKQIGEHGTGGVWLWDDDLDGRMQSPSRRSGTYQYSVKAPWSIIHPGESEQVRAPPLGQGRSGDLRAMMKSMTAGSSASLKSNAAAQLLQNSALGTIGRGRS